jgi:hypothetical protein
MNMMNLPWGPPKVAPGARYCQTNVPRQRFRKGRGASHWQFFFPVTLGHKECLGKPMAVGFQANSHWQLCRGESSQLQHLFQDQIHNLRGIGLE